MMGDGVREGLSSCSWELWGNTWLSGDVSVVS
jgi:hypothetical protein